MNYQEYINWCNQNGYITYNDWNLQRIDGADYFFIINPETDKFALIKQSTAGYEVLVKDWTDFNGYAEQFHKESFE